MNPLDNLERLAQRFVEGTFHRLFGKKLYPADLVDQLVASIEAERNGREENLLPARYHITLNPADYATIVEQSSNKEIVSKLITDLTSFAAEAKYQFDGSLRIALAQNNAVQRGQVEISPETQVIDRGRP